MILFCIIVRFYNRVSEMKELQRVYSMVRDSDHMTVIMGRRRIGKTRLIEEFTKDKLHIYLFVSRKSSTMLLEEFSTILRDFYGSSPRFTRWDDLFEYILTHAEEALILVLDEFQNFRYSSPDVFSVLQKVFDRYKQRGNVHMILMGSYISLMKRIFQDSKEPLFRRSTETLHLRELNASTVLSITSDMGFSPEEGVELYSIFGGFPKYYVMLEEQGLKGKSIPEILSISFFSDFPLLRDEVKSTLIENFGANYSTYFSVLEAISEGYNTFTKIANKTGIKRDSLPKYLNTLKDDFNLITVINPVTKEKISKRGRYRISDRMVEFWFRFVFGQSTMIETGRYDVVLEKTKGSLPQFVSFTFEELVREAVRNSMNYDVVGSWWSRKGDEIDVLAVNWKKRRVLAGEVKWRNRQMSCEYLDELERKVELSGFGSFKKEFLMVSKSGFTQKCIEKMKDKGVVWWELGDVIESLRNS